MVVVLAPAIDKICESLTYNPLTRAQGKPTFLSLILIHEEFIVNEREFESDFWGGQHGIVCIAMGDQ